MNNLRFGTLRIEKRTFPEWLTLYVFTMPFFLSFLLDFLHFPDFIKYTVDAALILIFLIFALTGKISLSRKESPFVLVVALAFIYVSIVYFFNFDSFFYFLWGVRNNYRMYAAFIAFSVFFGTRDVLKIFKFLDFLFWVNVPVTFYQFFVLDLNQDRLGGIFGVERGCNSYTIIFFLVVLSKSFLEYMNGRESGRACFLKLTLVMLIVAMAEIKVFFVFVILLLFMCFFLTKFSVKKFVLILLLSVVLFFASTVLTSIFGENQALDFERITELLTDTNYSSEQDLGRFTAVPTISKTILTNFPERLFGMGIGNCDTSAFAICNTEFFNTHQHLHYSWFSSAFIFLETGYIGLLYTFAFFIMCFFFAVKNFKVAGERSLFSQMSIIMSVFSVLLIFYNSSLRTEAGYIVYFVLALPLISQNEKE